VDKNMKLYEFGLSNINSNSKKLVIPSHLIQETSQATIDKDGIKNIKKLYKIFF